MNFYDVDCVFLLFLDFQCVFVHIYTVLRDHDQIRFLLELQKVKRIRIRGDVLRTTQEVG